MRSKNIRRSVAGALASLMCALSVPAVPTAVYSTAYAATVGQKLTVGGGTTQHKEDNVDGYSYEIWLDRTGGSGSMTLGSGGAFDTEWSAQVSQGNFLARRGRNYDASKKATQYGDIVMDYAADYSASSQGNSRLCVYGWFKDPLVEYYIIEDWVNWRPSAQGGAQTINVDGADYEIFQLDHTGPTILGDTRTFKQYFSVRKTKRTSGTITVSDHFKAWEKAGWNIGNLTEVALNVEGWESSGKANVSKLTISSKKEEQTTTQPAVTTQPSNPWSGNNTTAPAATTPSTSSGTTASQGTGLKGIFAPWFKIGTSVSPHELNSGASFLKENYNSITPENELKPDAIIDQTACQQKGNNVETQVNLSRAAQTLKFCEDNGISLRGHTFVWYSQTPDWFFRENFSSNGAYVSKDIMNKRLESFIKNTFAAIKAQYPKLDLYSYDVANELFLNNGGGMRPAGDAGSGGSNWVRIYGDDSFVINAFTYARKYAPAGCKLYLNDYNEYIGAKTTDIYNMAMKLKELGVIDGIGMQSHLATNYPDAKTYETALKKFLSTGLEVQITELDITCSDFTSQANLYEDIFKLAMEHADQIPALTIWGTTDNVSWRSSQNPLLFSQGYKPKPAYDKVVALAKSTSAPTPSTTQPTTQPAATQPTTQPTSQPTSQPSAASPSTKASMWGDANESAKVDISDAVIIMQSISNPAKYTLTDQGSANGDVNLSGNGITNADALAIQKYLVGTITDLPESYTQATATSSPTQQQTNAPATSTQAPAASNKTYVSADFASGSSSFEGRGDASLTVDKNSYISSPSSLYVTGRTDNWHGASIPLSVAAGNSYSFSAGVMQATGSSEEIQMTLQYTLDGEDHYDKIDSATCKDKEWTVLSNTSFAIPAGATNILLYFEMPGSKTADFYLDDVTVASDGTKIDLSTSGAKSNPSTPTVVTTPPSSSTGSTGGSIDPSKPMIAVSFDDGAVGSSPTASSMRIINALADQGFTATFFYVGSWTQQKGTSGAEEIKYAYSKGMEIANHTWTHPQNLPSMGVSGIQDEVNKTADLLKSITGAEPAKLLRLPYLNNGPAISQALPDYGLVTCQIDTQDWNGASASQIANTIKQAVDSGTGNGAVVLCHETYDNTAAAIEEVAPYIKAKGWQIASIGEMYAAKGKSIPGGQEIKRVY